MSGSKNHIDLACQVRSVQTYDISTIARGVMFGIIGTYTRRLSADVFSRHSFPQGYTYRRISLPPSA